MRLIAFTILMAGMLPISAHAQLSITKVMSNPIGTNAGRQWVEIANIGTTSIDLGAKTIRFYTSSGNHLIKEYANGGTVLLPGQNGVIAENPLSFLFDYPDYAGMLLKSSFTLPSAGLVGIVQTDGTVLARKSFVAVVNPVSSGGVFGKPGGVSKSTTKQATSRTTSASSKSHVTAKSKSSYGKGTLAPAAAANAAAAGAVFTMPALLMPLMPIFTSPWFTIYFALLTFSGFSLIMLERRHYS